MDIIVTKKIHILHQQLGLKDMLDLCNAIAAVAL